MSKLGPNQRYEIEIITPEEQVRRDPRGRIPALRINDSVFIKRVVEEPPKTESSIDDPMNLANELRDLAAESPFSHRELGEEN